MNIYAQNRSVAEEVLEECSRQIEKWGIQDYNPPEYLMILGKANKAALETYWKYDGKTSYEDYRKELVQVAAVAISAIGSLDRNSSK